MHTGDAWRQLPLDEAMMRLNDLCKEEAAVRADVVVDKGDESALVFTTYGLLRHWSDRLPDAVASAPAVAAGWYEIGSEDKEWLFPRTSFNLSLLPADTVAVTLPGQTASTCSSARASGFPSSASATAWVGRVHDVVYTDAFPDLQEGAASLVAALVLPSARIELSGRES